MSTFTKSLSSGSYTQYLVDAKREFKNAGSEEAAADVQAILDKLNNGEYVLN
jgi:hypothetical protein